MTPEETNLLETILAMPPEQHAQFITDFHNARLAKAIREAEERVRRETIEECAKVADQHSEQTEIGRKVLRKQQGREWDTHLHALRIAAAIRSLTVQTKGGMT